MKNFDSAAGFAAVVWMAIVVSIGVAPDMKRVVGSAMFAAPAAEDEEGTLLSDEDREKVFRFIEALLTPQKDVAHEPYTPPGISTDEDVQTATEEDVQTTMPSVTAKAGPLPTKNLKEPLSIAINGPVDALLGDQVFLTTETRGDVTSFTWSIDPPVKGLVVRDGGRSAVFTNRDAGVYTVLVSIAGNDGYSAHDFWTLELLERPVMNEVRASSIGKDPEDPDVTVQVRTWTQLVESPSKKADASIIAGSFRSVAQALESGRVNDGSNPLAPVLKESEEGMGPARFQAWREWFRFCERFLEERSAKGELASNHEFANAFRTLAVLVEAAAAGQQ